MDIVRERYDMAISRINEIAGESLIKEPYGDYFRRTAKFICHLDNIYQKIISGEIKKLELRELERINYDLYNDVYNENYSESYANPEFAVKKLGDDYGKMLCFLYEQIRKTIGNLYRKQEEISVSWFELFIEIYVDFEAMEDITVDGIRETLCSFMRDNTEIFTEASVDAMINPDNTFATDIVTKSDLQDLRYLYYYGEHVGYNEIEMAKYLNSLDQEKIDSLALVYTEGYRKGFINTGKDLSIKETVDIRYNIGFERIVKAAIKNFEKMGLKSVIYPRGYGSTNFNRQYWFDHKFDEALYLDKAYVKRKLEVSKQAFENRKEMASKMAGPAVIEVFGENPFEPENKKEAYSLDGKQQKLKVEFTMEYQQIIQEYIKGDERSFTIIAFPIPEFGENFREMFDATVKINTLDEKKYAKVQQCLIDALDKAVYVKVKGQGRNKTDIKVMMHELANPEKETNFENCLADVNIPLGEVFTSPKLKGTQGLLHVSEVYLGKLKYKNFEMTFEDGKVKDYNCSNFDSEEENKIYIKENVLYNHETLPIGEFAIGTNTTAYAMAGKFGAVYKLPILIVEKMGPHFAVGDTCYSYEEEIKTYNPDGKEIVARENEVSALRKTDISKAYFGCHTDITIPYDEIGEITAVTKAGEEITIIKNGKFVLDGTEMLNKPL
ncbi:aminopeptidase [Eubacterium sp. AF15-50]|uniref:aminopeptidase n=1 Tax=Eubacterium sp. AF15-50 TaxID=2293103 RepID=UPI002671359E|nr:aminopeptidase [Eubacterium sp. AF15-50]